eukprot:scaffold7359_cov255-Pinguiococcus_pyrenoidosus.AAC.21
MRLTLSTRPTGSQDAVEEARKAYFKGVTEEYPRWKKQWDEKVPLVPLAPRLCSSRDCSHALPLPSTPTSPFAKDQGEREGAGQGGRGTGASKEASSGDLRARAGDERECGKEGPGAGHQQDQASQ